MNKIVLALALILVCAAPVFAQATNTKKPEEKKPEALILGHEMRDLGLQYAAAIQDYEKYCDLATGTQDSCETASKKLLKDLSLKNLEDKMDLQISEHPSDGDIAYRKFLKWVRAIEHSSMTAIIFYKGKTISADLAVNGTLVTSICTAAAHDIAISSLLKNPSSAATLNKENSSE
jgi:hypothetical protein